LWRGTGRFEAAKLLQVAQVPVNFQDFASAEDETAHLIADNRLAELAEMDQDELQAILKNLDAETIVLTGFDPAELDEQIAALAKIQEQEAETQSRLDQKSKTLTESWQLLITCKNEKQQVTLLERFHEEGLEVRALNA
jgi:ParB-like chromosome segregation protein Spo0J